MTVINVTSAQQSEQPAVSDNGAYRAYITNTQSLFTEQLKDTSNLFRVDVSKIADRYLAEIPEAARQHYNCQACRSFVKRYGSLVTINADGLLNSPIWHTDNALPEHKATVEALRKAVERGRVTSVFYRDTEVLGKIDDPDHVHLSVLLPAHLVAKPKLNETVSQMAAVKQQAFHSVRTAVMGRTGDQPVKPYTEETLLTVIGQFQVGNIPDQKKFMPPLVWLRDLIQAVNAVKSPVAKDALIWKAVAAAPEGFCHPRSAVTGSLLDDVQTAPAWIEAAIKRFVKKIQGNVYMRPVAPPKSGAIDQGEKLIEQYGLATALRRRFAKLEEIETVWAPKVKEEAEAPEGQGVFAHLRKPEKAKLVAVQAKSTMSFNKFIGSVVPIAEEIYFLPDDRVNSYTGILTAVDADAAPLLMWDTPEKRNTFSTYQYNLGSLAPQFSLRSNEYHRVVGITKEPREWFGSIPVTGTSNTRLMVLEGAKDTRDENSCLFPEIIRRELHPVRSVIEAQSQSGKREGREEATACGLAVIAGAEYGKPLHFKVISGGLVAVYLIDRNET